MLTPLQVFQEVALVTEKVISAGLTDKENFPNLTQDGHFKDVGISGVKDIALALKNMPYDEIYQAMEGVGFYNFKMADGGLVQMLYRFSNEKILKHKLAYFPSPSFESFQNEPELYMEDCAYLEVLDRRILPVPVRFDFDCTEGTFEELHHPKSHLTLGQYKNCRIPVCSPLSPSLFIEFILRSFYNTAMFQFSEKIDFPFTRFDQTATPVELARVHVQIR